MNHKAVKKYLLSLPGAQLDYPFGENTAVYKVFVPVKPPVVSHADAMPGAGEQRAEVYEQYSEGAAQPATPQSAVSANSAVGSVGRQAGAVRGEWKMFALVTEKKEPVQISLKCDPLLAETLREKYESVMSGYHLNKKHWNTIVLTGQLSWDEVKDLIRHSYNLVAKT